LKTAAIDSADAYQSCFDTVASDQRGKIQAATIKLMLDFIGRCSTAELAQLIPGFCGQAVGVLDFGLCMDSIVRCRTCLLVNSINGLDEDCDGFDNGIVDGTCPPGSVIPTTTTTTTTSTTVPICGNGILQTGETCDDDNPNNQDMCTNQCVPAVCGDHIRCSNAACTTGPGGGPEQCDGLASAQCPGACLENCECAGATLPPTTTTTTTTTTSTTTTVTVPDIIQVFDHACIDAILNVPFLGGPQNIKSFGTVTLRIEMDTLGDDDGDNKEDVEAEVTALLFTASAEQGTIVVRLANPNRHPAQNQITRGLIEENVDSTPGLDWTPFGGGGSATVRFTRSFVEAQITGQINNVIHHDVPIDLLGTFDSSPPTANHPLVMQNATPVPVLTESDAQFLNSTISAVSLDLNASVCE
jgi:cysteine-rich repeat protein